MASFLSEEEVLGREGALRGDSEGQGCTSQHSPCCGLSESVTRITRTRPHSRDGGQQRQRIAVSGCDPDWHHQPRDQPPAGRSQRQCPGLKKEATHCEPEETSASCLCSAFCELTKGPRGEHRGLVHRNPFR